MKPFKTIAGRWKEHADKSGLETLDPRDKTLAMLMFVVGFSAALDALTNEIPDYPEAKAMYLLAKLHEEVEQMHAMATQALGGRKPS